MPSPNFDFLSATSLPRPPANSSPPPTPNPTPLLLIPLPTSSQMQSIPCTQTSFLSESQLAVMPKSCSGTWRVGLPEFRPNRGDSRLGRKTPASDKANQQRPPSQVKPSLGTAAWTLLGDQSSGPCWKPVASEHRHLGSWQHSPGDGSLSASTNLGKICVGGGGEGSLLQGGDLGSLLASQRGGHEAGTPTALPQPASKHEALCKRNPPFPLWAAFKAWADPSTGPFSHCSCPGSSVCWCFGHLGWFGWTLRHHIQGQCVDLT